MRQYHERNKPGMTIPGWGRVYIKERAVRSYKALFEGNPMRELYDVLREGEKIPHERVRDPGLRVREDWIYVAHADVLVALDPDARAGDDYNLVACFEWPFPDAVLSTKYGDVITEAFWKHRPEAESEEDVIKCFLSGVDIPPASYELYGLSEPTLVGGLYRLVSFPDGKGCFIALGPARNGSVGEHRHRAPYVILKYVPLPDTIPLLRVLPGVVTTVSQFHGPDHDEAEVAEIFHRARRLPGTLKEIKRNFKLKLPFGPMQGKDTRYYLIDEAWGRGVFVTLGPHRAKRQPGSAREVLVSYWHLGSERPKGLSIEELLAKSKPEPGEPEEIELVQALEDGKKPVVDSSVDEVLAKLGSAHVVDELNLDDLLG